MQWMLRLHQLVWLDNDWQTSMVFQTCGCSGIIGEIFFKSARQKGKKVNRMMKPIGQRYLESRFEVPMESF